MHDRLFAGQDEWSGNSNAVGVFKSYAADLALDTDAFNTCLDSGETASAVRADIQDGSARGVSATPSFLITPYGFIAGAYPFAAFEEAIEGALSGKLPTPTPTLSPAQANPLAPDPERPGYTYSGHAYKGAPDAPIMILEVSDFQCPFCKTHALGQGARIDEEYVETGKARVIYFHMLGHIHSQKSAEAAECAGNQGKFWEMHHLLFTETDEWWDAGDPVYFFKSYAETIGLDSEAFNTCIDMGERFAKVQNDHSIVTRGGITGTPTFIVNNQPLVGSPEYDTWKQILDSILEGVGE